jgi:autotransporter-associated beta strand protein
MLRGLCSLHIISKRVALTTGANRRLGWLVVHAAALTAVFTWNADALHAEPRSWDGGAGTTNWNDAANWNPNGVPTSTSDVTLGSSSSMPSTLGANQSINSLTIARTGSIFLGGSFPIPHTLTIQSGDVTRQDVAGTESDHDFLTRILIASDGLWNVAGNGELRVTELGQVGVTPINLTKDGNGRLVLEDVLYTGTTTVSRGALRIDGLSFGADVETSNISVASGSALELDNVSTDVPISLSGSGVSFTGALRLVDGNSTLSGPITVAFAASGDPAVYVEDFSTLTLSGGITDGASNGGLAKIGEGTLVLSGPGTFDNPVVVSQGTLVASHSMALGTNTTQVMAGATLELQNNVTIDRPLLFSGTGSIFGALYNSSGSNTWSGLVRLQADSEINVANNSTLALTGGIGLGAFSLTKDGAGTLVLSGNNSATGNLTVAQGVLRVTHSSALPSGITRILDRNTLELQNNVTINRALELGQVPFGGATLDSSSGSNTWSGSVTLLGDSTVGVGAGRLSISGNLSGLFAITKVGPGELALGGGNSYADTAVNEGVLTVQSSGALPAGRTVTVAGGAVLQIANNISTSATASLRLNGLGAAGQGAAFSNTQGTNTFAGPVKFITPTAIHSVPETTLTISGVISDDAAPLPLVKLGAGTLVLSAANTYRGGTVVNGGTLSINGDNRLGDKDGTVTLNNGAKLLVTANMSTDRTFNLNTGSIQVNAGTTLTLTGATVSGGFWRGPGTYAITGADESTVSGVTALAGSNILQNGAAALNNFSNAGTFTSNAPLTWDGGFNLGGGNVTVTSTLNSTAFQNDGQITLRSGGTLSNSGNDLASTGGSRITISSGSTLQLNGTNLNLHGGLLINQGTINGTTNVHFGALAKGTGSFGTVNVFDGGTFSPGDSPGTASLAAASFNAGGRYLFEIRDAAGAAGIGFDFMDIAGALAIAAGSTPNSQFVIDLATLDAANQPGLAANFNPSLPYSFVLATAAGGITGFSADVFRVDTSDFENDFAGGSFNIVQSGSDLLLNFTSGLSGDYNQDGTVDAADYVVWRKTDGSQTGYDQWRTNFGRTAGSGSADHPAGGAPSPSLAVVPEPTATVLAITALLAGVYWRRTS